MAIHLLNAVAHSFWVVLPKVGAFQNIAMAMSASFVKLISS